jgi:hypothetical protein
MFVLLLHYVTLHLYIQLSIYLSIAASVHDDEADDDDDDRGRSGFTSMMTLRPFLI